MIIKLIDKYWPILTLTIIIFAFFAKLFLPPSIFITPDLGRSDLLHFNIPIKTILWETLRAGALPLWDTRIGQGFAVFDEGQVGVFYIPNLVLFGLLPFWLAFDLGYVVTFLAAAIGVYLLARSLNLGKVASILAAITYSLSPIFTLHIHHYNLIQTAALMPWLFWLVNSFFNSRKLIFLMIIPLVLSQQLLAGFPQITFYSFCGLVIFFLFKIASIEGNFMKLKILTFFLLAITLAILIASPQINATGTITNQSQRFKNSRDSNILTDFPFKPINLLTIFNPYILGNPREGTYSRWQPGIWGIFWESNLYFGKIQLILIGGFLLSKFFKRKKGLSQTFFWAGFGLLGILLSLGSFAPLYPIFLIPPFSLFRVPSRFLLLTFLAAAVLAAIAVEGLFKKQHRAISKILIVLIVALAIVDIFHSWYSYNMVGEAKKWLAAPEIAAGVTFDSRIYSLGQTKAWNDIFLKSGWQNQESSYYFLRNFVSQNSNVDFGISQLAVYAGISPRRTEIIEGLVNRGIKDKGGELEIDNVSQKILNLGNVGFLIVAAEINSQKWQLVKTLTRDDQKIYLYKNLAVMPHVFAVSGYKIAKTVQDAQTIMSSAEFDPNKIVILEKEPNIEKEEGQNTAKITNYQNTKVQIQANFTSQAILVLSDSFYPGWLATIDGRQAEILAANVNSRAVIIPKGNHQVEFRYQPDYWRKWGMVSFASLILWIIVLVKTRKAKLS